MADAFSLTFFVVAICFIAGMLFRVWLGD